AARRCRVHGWAFGARLLFERREPAFNRVELDEYAASRLPVLAYSPPKTVQTVALGGLHHPRPDLIFDRSRRKRDRMRSGNLLLTRLLVRLTSSMVTTSKLAARGYVMDERPMPAGKKGRAEPEIIPPDGDDRQSR